MIERPRKLPFAATFVVWASRELTDAEKIVWFRTWALDRCTCGEGQPLCLCAAAGDACYAGAAALGEHTGKSARTVEGIRSRLRQLQLFHAFARREGRNQGWVAVLPITLPVGDRVRIADAARIAGQLDEHLRARLDWVRRGTDSDHAAPRSPAPPESTLEDVVRVRADTYSGREVRRAGGG